MSLSSIIGWQSPDLWTILCASCASSLLSGEDEQEWGEIYPWTVDADCSPLCDHCGADIG